MKNYESQFKKLLNAARVDALSGKESWHFALRYGLPEGPFITLARVAEETGLSRERVRTILLRAKRLMIARAKLEIESENTSQPCAKLALYI